jgi:hypothetical protein
MGIDINSIRSILYARILGVDYSQSAMLGRQRLLLSPSELKKYLIEFEFSFDEEIIHSIFNEDDGYSEELFRCIGANNIESFDNSAYEGATHIHDMNQEIPDSFKEQYSMVLDSGSLEHVFNFPVAIKNCMEMVKVGGHFLGITPINNFMGHGFYQFSPELYFSVFTRENGFEIINIIAFVDQKKTWFSVKSPLSVGERISLVNCDPTYLLVIAKKVARSPIFESLPQQSDYVAIWSQAKLSIDESISREDNKSELVKFIIDHIPTNLKKLRIRLIRRLKSGFSPCFFKPMAPTEGTDMPNKALKRTLIHSRR